MAYKYLLLEKEDGIGLLYINRPEAMNALNTGVLEEIIQAAGEISTDDEIQVLIITGAGDKSFVAGADIKEMHGLTAVKGREFGYTGQAAFRAIEKLEKPVIAAVNGFALGGGCELAMAADIRLASEKAKFGQPEVGLGITPGFGGTQRLPRLVGEGRAMELILTANTINVEEAYRIGLVNHIYPAATLLDEARKMARKIMGNAPLAVKYSKSAINKGLQTDIDTGMAIEADLFGICFSTEDQKAGMGAFLNKEKASFKAR
ncbi:MAG: enoyl-CoA hydratase-related protein [Syntrophomonadaceae bacterium]|jgi:enoyl-CoA hydratase|nr:enoyl-CoA hydratase-related protein [Syntrophomonadaceae bacterium]MDD3899267.1 enoyl-CoA hydratase-related protein [Syntrophomonadaceae bacterium]MDD4563142.1 enoyl-CoA hydratase-related protein [Syntrophomonadaceae bacterium]